jgi:hypothetical protein
MDYEKIRRILDALHAQGNIFYSKDRYAAYVLIAKVASAERGKKPM